MFTTFVYFEDLSRTLFGNTLFQQIAGAEVCNGMLTQITSPSSN
jgi:hypothetical protein